MPDPVGDALGAERSRILVVDDQDWNRVLLREMLQVDGHDVLEAEDGLSALQLAAQHDPDVVLLDVTMPGLDGFEVCRRLRAAPATAATPVLLITGLGQREDRLKGVAAGANDYLVKPIDRGEVSLRVRNALHIRRLHRAVDRQYRELQALEKLREDLVAMTAHDLRSPLTGLRGFLEMLEGSTTELGPVMAGLLGDAMRSVDRINGMIGDMLDVSRMESHALPLLRREADLADLARRAITYLGPAPDFHPVAIAVRGERTLVEVDTALVQRVLVNLVANAVRFSPSGAHVDVTIEATDTDAEVSVQDQGPGVPASEQAGIFEKFRQGGERRGEYSRSSGLGLTFCRMAVELHGGTIGVTSESGQGSVFWFRIPRRGAEGAGGP